MTDLENNWQPVRINDDGELIGGLFCAYCGEINEPDTDSCHNCGKYIADQGPDLNARLRRIRRYASSVHERPDERPQTDLIGSKYTERDTKKARSTSNDEFWRELARLVALCLFAFFAGLLIIALLRR